MGCSSPFFVPLHLVLETKENIGLRIGSADRIVVEFISACVCVWHLKWVLVSFNSYLSLWYLIGAGTSVCRRVVCAIFCESWEGDNTYGRSH
ncbi:hypothetical protein YC2023_031576 [Brassica napus]